MKIPVAFLVSCFREEDRPNQLPGKDGSSLGQGEALQIQYLGFRPKARGRDYAYLVIEANSKPREFVVSIPTQALMERRVRYQDAASICYQKLRMALQEETAERPLPRHATLSDQELDKYRGMHTPAKRHTSGNPQHCSNSLHARHPQRAVN
jgi:hypothetical protein